MNYREILSNVLVHGLPKQPTRVSNEGEVVPVQNSTVATFGEVFRHDMSEGFPLSTLRRLPFKSTVVELEFFMRGYTDKRWLQSRGCKYWDEFAQQDRPASVSAKDWPHLGPLGYSVEWRNFGGWDKGYITLDGVDQLRLLVDKLRSSPTDRRLLVSFWNPHTLDKAALPPCHLLHQIVVIGDQLNLLWYQRSVDIMLNQTIVTYGLLLLMYAKTAGLKPGVLQGIFADCHLYDNQVEAAKVLVSREEKSLPSVRLADDFDIMDWTHDQVYLEGYDPWPAVKTGAITV